MKMTYAAQLYIEEKSKRLRKNTLSGYISSLKKYVVPRFGEMEIEDISFDDVQEWVDEIEKPGAATKAFKTFRQVYRYALKHFQIQVYDVTQGIELPNVPVTHRPTLNEKQEVEMLRGIVGADFEAPVLFAATLGLRRCEACGLDWSDVDWRSGIVHIQRGVHYVDGEVIEYPTKTKLSDRKLKLPKFALERLRSIRGHRRAGRICEGMSPYTIANHYKAYCKRYNLPWVPMTCLRHSYATIALAHGATIEDISVTLGHQSVDTCIQHYIVSFENVVTKTAKCYTSGVTNPYK